ncbi:helix-turn-helix transcriptional regulator [Sedimentimonas flavescens]|uniref:helix-turn-helix transcriptional regulator n=1 Tax=Sedimentimonas flavescens TaxID=2851012 RepID=UPI001C4A2950|nr:WYL domain-containing protein [Sedimentimonas flavescens]MBW0158412.1 WYL domain-containing protein [Sedimentimonas flavescens]
MSFQKASDLLRLAELAASRFLGVGLTDIEQIFEVDRRTAQRMTKALEDIFPHCETRTDEERRKYWKIPAADLKLVVSQGIRDSELAAIDMSIRRAERDGAADEVRSLRSLRDRLLAAMPGPHARRAEADAEAMLEAQGFASRPGPTVRSDLTLLQTISAALKGPFQLSIRYKGANDIEGKERLIEPHGLLLGTRRYLVARPAGGDGSMRQFRLDRISEARLQQNSFARDSDFDIATHASRAFGSYHAEIEYGEVVWRFRPAAAAVAREFVFHPLQELTEDEDGALIVRFSASGHLEMAWHLYQWGDSVEVLKPDTLREMVQHHRRGDFPSFP